jgi:hypothetical protein
MHHPRRGITTRITLTLIRPKVVRSAGVNGGLLLRASRRVTARKDMTAWSGHLLAFQILFNMNHDVAPDGDSHAQVMDGPRGLL